MLDKFIKELHSDISPLEGREGLERFCASSPAGSLSWEDTGFSLEGELVGHAPGRERNISLLGKIRPHAGLKPASGWVEVETAVQTEPDITDLYLVGSRPLPRPDITCICRHPVCRDYLVAGTAAAELLLLDARLPANLQVLAETHLAEPLASLVCCGRLLLGLERPGGQYLQIIAITDNQETGSFLASSRLSLPIKLTALAENDTYSAWGLTVAGEVYRLELPPELSAPDHPGALGAAVQKVGKLGRSRIVAADQTSLLKSCYRAVKGRKFAWRYLCPGRGAYTGLAFDGRHYWSFRSAGRDKNSGVLRLYDQQGKVMRAFASWPEVSLTAINYSHNHLLVLDLEHQQLHQYHLADTAQPMASLASIKRHPGYLPAGTMASGGIHDLCLLYVGSEGKDAVHSYDIDKLRPLVGYVDPQGLVQDYFMDGFLLLAQYSPLLNGHAFSSDLKGLPARQEDWRALFDEYFRPQANLQALDACAQEISSRLGAAETASVKVVLGLPAPDRRCLDWNQSGLSLTEDSQRIEVTRWAMQELIERWARADFQCLTLAGFYYISEQGAWNDPLLKLFPHLCHEQGVRSFAIPGLTSAWITEFSRAGFDCVALQSSHAFWKPLGRTRYHALKSAGRIARDFGMGMEVEIPYNIQDPAGEEKLRDYLKMAQIQGWAGAFKTYFQSYNLIKSLAESQNPATRELYDELYRLSRITRRSEMEFTYLQDDSIAVACECEWKEEAGAACFRINVEGYQGSFELTNLSVK